MMGGPNKMTWRAAFGPRAFSMTRALDIRNESWESPVGSLTMTERIPFS